MLLKDLISEALCEPTDYKGYHISRKLAELCNDRAIVEGCSCALNLGEYAKAQQCSIVNEASVHNQIETEWNGLGEDITYSAENSWLNILWCGQLLAVLLVSWLED